MSCKCLVDHDAAYDDDGSRISSVGKVLDCRVEGHRFYSHAEPILRVVLTVALQMARPSHSLDDQVKWWFHLQNSVPNKKKVFLC